MSESRLYVPVASRVFTRFRDKYAEQLKQLDNPYVAIYIDRTFIPEQNEKNLADLKVNLEYLKNLGFDALVWIQAFGFGIGLQGMDAECAAAFTRITGVSSGCAGPPSMATVSPLTSPPWSYPFSLMEKAMRSWVKLKYCSKMLRT